ncbi:S-layer homology domain-containing protein [Selenomonas ruminantium]|uniref:OmpA-like transmembrane domain-containing protein n=1 Tax=Selenomonas ruminantium TaxID=971 RepID=A0A1I0XEM2_SELRU|nr:S-layer homology domain-containing protein [Selenomonas ruminantium]SFA98760.1 OmpA-like transmembrane domain-containing protein [Selenomonas ruminantium]
MKKTLVSALTTALVVGAASTTFAAANPFSDVPADHWAYDAVSQLAADGVIDGYGDSTFKGNRNITRYEMAQMVAKAMAKNTSGADKALVDKLAAEFAEELNNLGVRVAKLERNADMVKWNGKAEYTFTRNHYEDKNNQGDVTSNDNKFLFRLEPSAEVNKNWHVNARLDAWTDSASDAGDGKNSEKVELKRIWAQGDYKNFQVRVGKMGNKIANDIVFDDPFSGIDVTFGKQVQATLAYGRVKASTFEYFNNDASATPNPTNAGTIGYWGVGVKYDAGKKLTARAAYQNFGLNYKNNDASKTYSENMGVWSIGAGYKFDKNFAIDATYARGNKALADGLQQKTAFAYGVSYKGAQPANKGSWGAWVGYRYLGQGAAFHPTYDVVKAGYKGLELGVKYVPWKNIVTQVQYGTGANIDTNKSYNTLFGRVEFLF